MGKLREWLNNNSAIVTVAAVLVLLMALGIIIYTQGAGRRGPTQWQGYYMDLGTNELFAGKSTDIPPVDAPSGANQGVRAHVYGCGDCSEANRFIAYLERYTEKAKQMRLNPPQYDPNQPASPEVYMDEMTGVEVEVRAPKGTQWMSLMSEQGMRITEIMPNRCPDGVMIMPCLPGQ